MFRLYLYARVRISMHTLHTRPRVQRAPGIPCTLRFRREGTSSCKPRAQCVARMRSHICVGWVERSETQSSVSTAMMGIAAPTAYYELLRGTRFMRPRAQRVANPSTVIASAAKQSILSLCREVDCFASLAMTRIGRGVPDTPHLWDMTRRSGRAKSSSRQRRDFADVGHAHVKGRFPVQIDND